MAQFFRERGWLYAVEALPLRQVVKRYIHQSVTLALYIGGNSTRSGEPISRGTYGAICTNAAQLYSSPLSDEQRRTTRYFFLYSVCILMSASDCIVYVFFIATRAMFSTILNDQTGRTGVELQITLGSLR